MCWSSFFFTVATTDCDKESNLPVQFSFRSSDTKHTELPLYEYFIHGFSFSGSTYFFFCSWLLVCKALWFSLLGVKSVCLSFVKHTILLVKSSCFTTTFLITSIYCMINWNNVTWRKGIVWVSISRFPYSFHSLIIVVFHWTHGAFLCRHYFLCLIGRAVGQGATALCHGDIPNQEHRRSAKVKYSLQSNGRKEVVRQHCMKHNTKKCEHTIPTGESG